ncbi:kinase-like protein [Patellaria atrata CBS 101060]|uniref:cyclin-dependent kinase n=1 Tax=Patellaria atrata CBS 101060 TaxID=1346257 RepID=A0A9P4S5M6_9PEZI|nr:kinase-like protein [Patellaria atrata CBS 101060]
MRSGLFSHVYRAPTLEKRSEDSVLSKNRQEFVALKVTTPSLMTAPHDSRREARILSTVEGPNILRLLDTFQQAGDHLVLVFPFMSHDLETLIRLKKLSKRHSRSCLQDMFTGLAHIHSRGIIHRDIKPSNILLRSISGPAYIADFGIAWSNIDPSSEPPDEKITDVGTTCYRAPELLFGNTHYGSAIDLWAAGCVVAEVEDSTIDSLFDSGDLGSDLALIKSIFESLGTPDLITWPEAETFRDWGKMMFYEYPARKWSELLPNASDPARSLASSLVQYQSSLRLSAEEVIALLVALAR